MPRGHIVGTIRIEPHAERAPAKPRTGDATLGDLLAGFAQHEDLASMPADQPQRLVARRVSRRSPGEQADAFARANLAALMEELEAELAEAVEAAS
jgi:hypothetical protein